MNRALWIAAPAVLVLVSACGSSAAPSTVTATVTAVETTTETAAPVSSDDGTVSVSDGTYLVGTDIKAGTYRTDGPASSDILDSCYWERAKDDSGSLDSIIANDNITGPGRLTVKAGQILKLDGGCEWTRA